MMTPFARDGHLSDLGLELLLAGEVGPDAHTHVQGCDPCRLRADAARELDAELAPLPAFLARAVPPSVDVAPPVVPMPANRPIWTALLVMAAAVLLAVLVVPRVTADPSTDSDTWRLKGRDLSLQVFRDAGAMSERLRDGAAVGAGDRVGFRVRNRTEGHLMIVGLTRPDPAATPYVCYPQDAGERSVPIGADDQAVSMPQAVRMDAATGEEHIYAVRCTHAFALADIADSIKDGADLPQGCSSARVRLEKR